MSEGILELQNESLNSELQAVSPDGDETRHVIEGMIGRGERWDKSLAQSVMFLHDGVQRRDADTNPLLDTKRPPKIVLVTATRAIPYAVAVKECWKKAYPMEKPPKFFFIDVSEKRFGWGILNQTILSEGEMEQINFKQIDRMKTIGEKHKAFDDTAVFDEFRFTGRTSKEVQKQLGKAGFVDVNFMNGQWGYDSPSGGITEEMMPVIRKRNQTLNSFAFQVNEQSKSLMKDMKTIGNEMAKEIKRHASIEMS